MLLSGSHGSLGLQDSERVGNPVRLSRSRPWQRPIRHSHSVDQVAQQDTETPPAAKRLRAIGDAASTGSGGTQDVTAEAQDVSD